MPLNETPAQSSKDSGQVVALTALFFAVLMGFTALAVDYGTYLMARRTYQNVADAGAIAGSVYLSRPLTGTKQDNARVAAWTSVRDALGLADPSPMPNANQWAAGATVGDWTIWIATPPTQAGSDYPGDTNISGGNSVFVRVQRDNPAFLSRFLGYTERTINGWATAGSLPSRWAVIALCPRTGPCPANVESIVLAGTNTALRIIDGDMGSNWGFKINSNADDRLQLPGDSKAYISEVVATYCGNSTFRCYPSPNVSDGAGTPKQVQTLPSPVLDPGYPLPAWIDDTVMAVPFRGDASHDVIVAANQGTIQSAASTNVGCNPASPRIGPGTYRDITVRANSCVILDPTLGLTPGQRPGVYVLTRDLDIGNGSFLIGDGVTIFWRATARDFNPGGGIVINNGNADIAAIPDGEDKFGAWTTRGSATWTVASATGTTTWVTPPTADRGIAFYVRPGASPTSIFNMSGSTPLMFKGILYAPRDNVGIAGAGSQAAVGQIIGWTVTYNGNTLITQEFDGPADTQSYLLEPRTGQPD